MNPRKIERTPNECTEKTSSIFGHWKSNCCSVFFWRGSESPLPSWFLPWCCACHCLHDPSRYSCPTMTPFFPDSGCWRRVNFHLEFRGWPGRFVCGNVQPLPNLLTSPLSPWSLYMYDFMLCWYFRTTYLQWSISFWLDWYDGSGYFADLVMKLLQEQTRLA